VAPIQVWCRRALIEEFQIFATKISARNCSSQKTGVKTGRISGGTGAVSREPWQCLKCTYANKAEAVSCEMCQNFRGAPAASLNIEGRLVEKPSRFSEHKYMPPNATDLVNNSDHSPSEVSNSQFLFKRKKC
jgi:Zn-finger in Ran binding protein and others